MEEAEELLGGSLYAGRLEGEPDCEAHAFVEVNQVRLSWKAEGLCSILMPLYI